ncbi:exportin-7-B [Diaphorina citri]|uniref:Exportin-7-B n=1 Tax=Diaphorina citri TaxID=121845 RepID=A0A3Q0IY60_DIACI|nr:exportin-7-B [Diaphorina citri]
MAEEQEVRQLECLCKQLYESADGNLRVEAEKALVNFQNAPDTLAKCQLLLDRGDSSYAQAIAANTLTKLISRPAQGLSLQQRIDIRNYILNYLATRPKLPNFVIQALVTLFARITKLGWFDSEKDEFVFRNVIQDVSNFLQGSVEHCIIGVQILSQLTGEMNQISEADAARSLTKHRKIASSYRDIQLFDIFRLSCSLLSNAQENCKTMTLEGEGQIFMTQLLGLAQNCLTFDFIGTATDESSDDLCTVQIPTSWRPAFLDPNTLKLFFNLYHSLPSTLSHLALACLVQIASVRRSLFSNAERARFLTQLVNGVKQILQNPQGLSDANNYHEFCRLLARLKSNYQLGELVMVDNYSEAIQLIAKFTVESLQMWQFAPNSVHYLLSLWQRMVASVPYIKAMEPHQLHTYTPEVTSAYITSRLDSVAVVIRDNLEDPLDDLGMVSQQLEQLSAIGRCEYQKTCSLLVQLFDQSARLYQELISTPSPNQIDIAIQEGRLTWLVYIIGAAVGGRVSFNSNEDHDAMDGELVCRVLQLMNLTDPRLLGPGPGCEKLELAMLSFFEQFRKIYVGDQVQKNSKVYRRLNEVLGLCDEATVLSVFVRKIITNLKYWGRSEQIITKTLQLLNDLSVGYSCVRKLVKLDEVQFMLNNHTVRPEMEEPLHFSRREYGDEALDNALKTFVKLLLSINQSDLLLEVTDTMVCTGCCATLDHIVTYLFKQITNKGKKKSGRPGASPTGTDMFLLQKSYKASVLECTKKVYIIRLYLLYSSQKYGKYFNQLRENIVRGQPPDKQASMVQWFENLMNSIERNLLTKNRDRFTQNLSMFRRDINDSLKGPNMNSSCTANDMMT